MRIIFGNSADRRWYVESGSISWGFGIEVQHFGEPYGEADNIIPQGWLIGFMFGPWKVDLFNEAGAKATFGKSLTYMGRISQL